MLVDIVQTFDEQTFEGDEGDGAVPREAGPSRNEGRHERDGHGAGSVRAGGFPREPGVGFRHADRAR